jgi:hypothetical protein
MQFTQLFSLSSRVTHLPLRAAGSLLLAGRPLRAAWLSCLSTSLQTEFVFVFSPYARPKVVNSSQLISQMN